MSIEREFEEHYGVSPTLRVRCPGRVNLIGEHIDYMGYGVFPMAIEQETVVLLAPTSDRLIRFHNVEPATFPDYELKLPSNWRGASPPKWFDYFLSGWKGALEKLSIPSEEVKGMLIQVSGNVPHSSGLSSSSSLVCAAALATFVFYTGVGFEKISRYVRGSFFYKKMMPDSNSAKSNYLEKMFETLKNRNPASTAKFLGVQKSAAAPLKPWTETVFLDFSPTSKFIIICIIL